MATAPDSANTHNAISVTDSLIERLLFHANNNPDHDAVVTSKRALSYEHLFQLVLHQAQQFQHTGLSAESVIGIQCADDLQHLILCLAATYIGATSCTIPSHETSESQQATIKRCGANFIAKEAIDIDPALNNTGLKEDLTEEKTQTAKLLFSTSGTTGEAKLVVHQSNDLVAQAHRHIDSEQERFACLASMEHNFAKRHRLYCVAEGATNIFIDARQEDLVKQCQSLRINVMHVSAFQAQELLATPGIEALSSIRLKLGGSHVPTALRQQLRNQITTKLQAGYGTTETGAIGFTAANDIDAGESVGQPLPGIEIRVVSPDRKTLNQGEQGELAIRCEGMFRGYLGKADLTDERLIDGWFYTGDIGYLDQQQRIHLCGRSDDMFVFNSMNIYPQDIESEICQFPGITDAAVLPKPSSIHGNIPVALVVFNKETKPKLPKLKKFVQNRVGLRCPRQFTIVDEIPRNASGKIARKAVMGLSNKSDEVRHCIVQSLDDRARASLEPSVIEDFEKGNTDIRLRGITMDSLARMNLLIALEVSYDAIITPQEFAQFRTLGNIVARVLSLFSEAEPEGDNAPEEEDIHHPVSGQIVVNSQPQPYIVRFFQRIFSYCHTVAQLYKALTTLEHRLTPLDIELLHSRYTQQQLIPANTAKKFHHALSQWLNNIKRMMDDSGKQQHENFKAKRITSTASYFSGPGSPAEKTLLVCFSVAGGRCLMMPNAVLMQHTDATRYDLLIISEPLNESYRLGVPLLGDNVIEVIKWIADLDLVKSYQHIRTVGSSAGCFPAVIAGYHLKAELVVSVGGRFHSEHHPGKILDRIITTWRAVKHRQGLRVLMSFDKTITRDRHYAKIMAWLTRGNLAVIEFSNGNVGHSILERLVERGELAPYLTRTVFAKIDDDHVARRGAKTIICLPEDTVRPY